MRNGWRRLGRHVAARRAAIGWSARDLADEAGLSLRTVEYIEAGEHRAYRPITLARLEAALGWVDGSAERVLDGGQPRLGSYPLLDRINRLWPSLTDDQRRTVATLVETLARQP